MPRKPEPHPAPAPVVDDEPMPGMPEPDLEARDTAIAAVTGIPPIDARNVPLDTVTPSPDNPRTDLDVDDELIASVRADGILEPLVVAPADGYDGTEDRPRWDLIFGHRRLEAARLAGLPHVPVIVRPDLAGDRDALRVRLIENLHRLDLSPLDEARGYHRLIEDFGLSQKEVADAVGRNQGHVSKRLDLLDLVPEAAELLRTPKPADTAGVPKRRLSLEAAVDLSKLPKAVQRGAVDLIAGGSDPARAIDVAKTRAADLAARGKVLRALKTAGVPVIDLAADHHADDDVTPLAQLGLDEAARDGHTKLKCHVVVVYANPQTWESGDRRWSYLGCTAKDPFDKHAKLVHRPGRAGTLDPEAEAARVAAQTAAEENRRRRDGLAERRWEFLKALLGGKKPKGAVDYLARAVVYEALSAYRHEDTPEMGQVNDLLGVTGALDGDYGPIAAAEADLTLGGDPLLRWALACRLADDEQTAASEIGATLSGQNDTLRAANYLAFLSASGLELDDLERAVIDGCPPIAQVLINEELVDAPSPDPALEGGEPGDGDGDAGAAWDAAVLVPDYPLPYATADGRKKGELVTAYRCPECGGIELGFYPLEINHGVTRPHLKSTWAGGCRHPKATTDATTEVDTAVDGGEAEAVPDYDDGPVEVYREDDDGAKARGVKPEAITDLIGRTGGTTGHVYLQPGVATANGMCPVCHGWAKVITGLKVGKHPAPDGATCVGRNRTALTPAEAHPIVVAAISEGGGATS